MEIAKLQRHCSEYEMGELKVHKALQEKGNRCSESATRSRELVASLSSDLRIAKMFSHDIYLVAKCTLK